MAFGRGRSYLDIRLTNIDRGIQTFAAFGARTVDGGVTTASEGLEDFASELLNSVDWTCGYVSS